MRRIGDLLLAAGVLTRDALDELLARQVAEGEERIASQIYALGLANERKLCEALADLHGTPTLVLTESTIDVKALALVPKVIAETQDVLAVAVDDETLTVAVVDPDPGPILQQLEFASGRRVEHVVAVERILKTAIPPAYEARERREVTIRGHASPSATPHLALVRIDSTSVESLAEIRRSSVATDLSQILNSIDRELPPEARIPLVAVESAATDIPLVRPAERPAPVDITDVDIVLAEDDEAIAQLIKKTLEHDGYVVEHELTGDGAVDLLRRRRPRLVLLDAMLPGAHGFEICTKLKQSDAYRGVPVVMISAVYKGWEQAREIQEVYGADGFIEKPFDVHYLRKLVASLLGSELGRVGLDERSRDAIASTRARYDDAYLVGDWDAAGAALEAWLTLDPFDPMAYLERGALCAEAGDLPAAMRAYEHAAVYGPRVFAAHMNLAMTYEKLGFARRAASTWRAAQALAPDERTRVQIEDRLAEAAAHGR